MRSHKTSGWSEISVFERRVFIGKTDANVYVFFHSQVWSLTPCFQTTSNSFLIMLPLGVLLLLLFECVTLFNLNQITLFNLCMCVWERDMCVSDMCVCVCGGCILGGQNRELDPRELGVTDGYEPPKTGAGSGTWVYRRSGASALKPSCLCSLFRSCFACLY